MGASKTRLGLSATSRGRYGSFAGKTPEVLDATFLPYFAQQQNALIQR